MLLEVFDILEVQVYYLEVPTEELLSHEVATECYLNSNFVSEGCLSVGKAFIQVLDG